MKEETKQCERCGKAVRVLAAEPGQPVPLFGLPPIYCAECEPTDPEE